MIIDTWLKIQMTEGETITDIARELEQESGKKITTSRLREWQRGERGIPPEIYNVVIENAVYQAMKEVGITMSEEQIVRVRNMLRMPTKGP